MSECVCVRERDVDEALVNGLFPNKNKKVFTDFQKKNLVHFEASSRFRFKWKKICFKRSSIDFPTKTCFVGRRLL